MYYVDATKKTRTNERSIIYLGATRTDRESMTSLELTPDIVGYKVTPARQEFTGDAFFSIKKIVWGKAGVFCTVSAHKIYLYQHVHVCMHTQVAAPCIHYVLTAPTWIVA